MVKEPGKVAFGLCEAPAGEKMIRKEESALRCFIWTDISWCYKVELEGGIAEAVRIRR